ncbi:C40 family peptidase [Nocardia stercoris]|nr:C40 family peptidase [Nocardia stercoris]
MGKHSMQRESKLPNSVKGALVMGAAAVTTGAFPALSAGAATLNIPGVGNFDVPPEFDQQVTQANQLLSDHADDIKAAEAVVNPQALAPAQVPTMPSLFGQPQVQNTAGERALDAAKSQIGTEYVWGGNRPGGFDCSGLTSWAYEQAGVDIPRTSFEQSNAGQPVALDDLQPGDLLVTNGGGHVVMYAGDGQILQAPQSGETVSYAPLNTSDVVTARRIVA